MVCDVATAELGCAELYSSRFTPVPGRKEVISDRTEKLMKDDAGNVGFH